MNTNVDKKRIEEIFDRGIITEVIPSRQELFEKFLSGEKLKIYIGADPTSNSLHLSHAKNYMLLEELRQLGHEVIILFGDFTAKIGDPTGRPNARLQLSDEQVQGNVKNWISQIKPLLDLESKQNPPKILFNSEWLSKLTLSDVVNLAAQFTVQQMIERDMFEKRWENNIPIHLHEFLYPLMQGYDSVAMEIDVELCGTDQIFNALAGRTLLKRLKNKDKYIIAVNLMANPKTNELMSKSAGTGVFLSSPPNEMYGSIMAQPDEMIKLLFINNTRISFSEIEEILAQGPRSAKARVAFEIVKIFYGQEDALTAEREFDKTFSQGGLPDELKEVSYPKGTELVEILLKEEVVASKTEFRRLLAEGAIKKIQSIEEKKENIVREDDVLLQENAVYKIGKRRFLKVTMI